MKKFIVKYKDGEKIFGEYESKEEASAKLIEFIVGMNKALDVDYFSPFDFSLEKVECEVNEVITDFDSAKKYLVGNTNDDKKKKKKRLSKSIDKIKDAEILIKEINPKHIEALMALNKLFTIADAWNKADGFVPDFSDWEQKKYAPWFNYDKDANRFVCVDTCVTYAQAYIAIGHRLCFKTSERAKQFGKQFAELYNKVFL